MLQQKKFWKRISEKNVTQKTSQMKKPLRAQGTIETTTSTTLLITKLRWYKTEKIYIHVYIYMYMYVFSYIYICMYSSYLNHGKLFRW